MKIKMMMFILLLVGSLLGVVIVFAASVPQATITVNSTADTLVAGDNECTLREAINNANTNSQTTGGDCMAGSGADVIMLPAGTYDLTISGINEDNNATGDLDILDPNGLTIQGSGAEMTIIDGNLIDRVFHVVNPAEVAMTGITIRGGDTPNNGGGLSINQGGSVTIQDAVIADNNASHGGGISIEGGVGGVVLYLANTVLRSNQAVNQGGAMFSVGSSSLVFLDGSTVEMNTAGFDGGGLFKEEGAMTLSNSTVAGNTAGVFGGGIMNSTGDMTMVNSTVSGNFAINGGGIFNDNNQGVALLTNVTVASNVATGNGGGLYGATGVLTLVNTIVADNVTGGDCFQISSGLLASSGHNLDSDGSCPLIATGDISSGIANLGPLQNNGGQTKTHELLPGSHALDAASLSACPPADQRGVTRPQGDGCDIGAYEKTNYKAYLPSMSKQP